MTLAVGVETPKDVRMIKETARNAGSTECQKWNVSDILKRTRGLAIRLKEGWCLSSSGRTHVARLGVTPSGATPKVVDHAAQLRAAVSRIADQNTREFLTEGIVAYECKLYRAAVVLSWAGAVFLLQEQVMKTCLPAFNAEAGRRDPKWRAAKIKDDLGRMKESDFLDIIGSPPLSVIGQNLKEGNSRVAASACENPAAIRILCGSVKTRHLRIWRF